MLEVGFKEDNAYLKSSENHSKYVWYYDCSLVRTECYSYGRFEIPNSRYVLGFSYKIIYLTDAKDFYGDESKLYLDEGFFPDSYYEFFIALNEKTDSNDGDGGDDKEVFSDYGSFGDLFHYTDDHDTATYSGYDASSYIFSKEHTTDEIYEKLRSYFDNPSIKEKLLIEKQAN